MSENNGWTQEDMAAIQAPFEDQSLDQFVETMGQRGYPIKTASDLQQALVTAEMLQEKIASGEYKPVNSEANSEIAQLSEKIASAFKAPASKQDPVLHGLQQKAAQASLDPFSMYSAAALDSIPQA